MNNNFEMNIVGIFQLSRNVTAFVGNVLGHQNRITSTKAQLIIDGVPTTIVEKLNEAIGDRPSKNNLRSLETHQRVDLTQEFIDTHNCKLIGIE